MYIQGIYYNSFAYFIKGLETSEMHINRELLK